MCDIIFPVIILTNQTEQAKKVLSHLIENGFQAYFVGGFVRDQLLGIPVEDIDITTDATPLQVQNLFKKTRATGLKYGTITVFVDQDSFEVTTFRSEGKYRNHRHPEEIRFSQRLEEDLKRRDFTINALAMDMDEKIIDLFGGLADIREKKIRAIGNPDERFQEDALRILRAFRFVSKLDFTIEQSTQNSISAYQSLLPKIANERIIQEISKIIRYPHFANAIRQMDHLITEAGLSDLQKGIHQLASLESYSLNEQEFYALCFYMNQADIPDRWRFSKKEKDYLHRLMMLIEVTEADPFNELLVYAYGLELCLQANQVHRLLGSNINQEKLIRDMWEKMPIHSTCELAFKGEDILQLHLVKDEAMIGEVIDLLIEKVITGHLQNDYITLKNYVHEYLKSRK